MERISSSHEEHESEHPREVSEQESKALFLAGYVNTVRHAITANKPADAIYTGVTHALSKNAIEAIDRAVQLGQTILPDEQAQEVAALLAPFPTDRADTDTILDFATTGEGHPLAIRSALLGVRRRTNSEKVTLLTDWLSTHFLQRHQQPDDDNQLRKFSSTRIWAEESATEGVHPTFVFGFIDQSARQGGRKPVANIVQRRYSQHGEPFRAFLRLPAVNAASDQLEDTFLDRSRGLITTPEEYLAAEQAGHRFVDLNGKIYHFSE